MLRRCRFLRSVAPTWQQKLTSDEAKTVIGDDNSFQKRYGDWDPAEAALVAFKPEETIEVQLGKDDETMRLRKMALRGSYFMLAPLLLYYPNGLVTALDKIASAVLVSFGVSWGFMMNTYFIRLVQAMRIVPKSEDSPAGAVVEIVTGAHCFSKDVTITNIKLQNVLNVSCTKEGEWVSMTVRNEKTNNNDSFYLMAFKEAYKVIPYILSMKNHLIEEVPECYTPTYVTLANVHLGFLVSIESLEMPPISIQNPYPDFAQMKPLKLRPGSLGYEPEEDASGENTK
eukprot:TRINITY_DN11783_c0_g1_i1.p1 TRINITY_DN11783_c0_g1~~TRINITY_DN11783_c0_g1_i1.p1  ORF type:complete len:285 (+),score=50.13 TRINITY_DN11783_c0_g1_i1:43-897(+)